MDVGGIKDCKPIYDAAGAKFVTLVDPQNAMGEAWGFKLVPNGWLIDESGILKAKWVGRMDVGRTQVMDKVEQFLAAPSVAKGSIKAAKSDALLRKEYRAVLKKSPYDGPANLGIGQIMLRQGSAKEASTYLGRAVSAMPKSANAMFALGSSILAQGDKDTALTILKNALKLDAANYLIRKQIWHLEYPEKFHPEIDWGWQREQMARERAAEKKDGG
ncbi:MAG: hypothetical protein IH945_09765 [Armatimonadetes bacterium]|nr:hypothetical protein [Armatimonadota bacterium]